VGANKKKERFGGTITNGQEKKREAEVECRNGENGGLWRRRKGLPDGKRNRGLDCSGVVADRGVSRGRITN